MEALSVTDWGQGAKTLQLPTVIRYAEIYSSDGTYLLSQCLMKLDGYSNLSLSRENFDSSDFPLNVIAFSESDASSGKALFNQRINAPFGSVRFAIGRRRETAKNVRFDELVKFVNNDGNIYITKEFTGIDYDKARRNLNLYSKYEFDRKTQGFPTSAVYTNYAEAYATPYIMNGTTPATARITSTYSKGEFNIHVEITCRGYAAARTGVLLLGTLEEIIGSNAFVPESSAIAYAKVPLFPNIEYQRYDEDNQPWGGRGLLRDLSDFPVLIATNNQSVFNGVVPQKTLCLVCCNIPKLPAHNWMGFTQPQAFVYDLKFYPNDEQLR